MRTLLISVILFSTLTGVLTACGYRTPLKLPDPGAKPPASAPEKSDAK